MFLANWKTTNLVSDEQLISMSKSMMLLIDMRNYQTSRPIILDFLALNTKYHILGF